MRIMAIVADSKPAVPRPLVVPAPLDFECSHRQMWLVICNVAGTLAPEPWPELAKVTGIEALRADTSTHADYDSLMKIRIDAMRKNGIKADKLFLALKGVDPFPGSVEFLQWLKPVVPRCFMITDSFEEYAKPVFEKLGHPAVFCNFLETDAEGYVTRLVSRVRDQKKSSVEEFQRLNFRTIMIGHSFNDIPALKAANAGILFKPCEGSRAMMTCPDMPTAHTFEELKLRISEIVSEEGPAAKKQKVSQ